MCLFGQYDNLRWQGCSIDMRRCNLCINGSLQSYCISGRRRTDRRYMGGHIERGMRGVDSE